MAAGMPPPSGRPPDAPVQRGQGVVPARRFDSPVTDWQWWLGPLGLLVALVAAVFAAAIVDLVAAGAGVHTSTPENLPGGLVLIDTLLQDAIFVGTAVLLARRGLRRVRSSQFGLVGTPRRRAALLVVGAFLAFLAFGLFWALLIKTEEPEKLLEQLGANEGILLLAGSALLTCVVAPICEEFLFRGFIFTCLRNLRGPWLAAVLTGLLFGAVHATSAPGVDLLPLAALGFILCVLYRATGSLYPCMALHALNNSIAFGALEGWGWQIPVVLAGALTAIFLIMRAASALGWIQPDGLPTAAPPGLGPGSGPGAPAL